MMSTSPPCYPTLQIFVAEVSFNEFLLFVAVSPDGYNNVTRGRRLGDRRERFVLCSIPGLLFRGWEGLSDSTGPLEISVLENEF